MTTNTSWSQERGTRLTAADVGEDSRTCRPCCGGISSRRPSAAGGAVDSLDIGGSPPFCCCVDFGQCIVVVMCGGGPEGDCWWGSGWALELVDLMVGSCYCCDVGLESVVFAAGWDRSVTVSEYELFVWLCIREQIAAGQSCWALVKVLGTQSSTGPGPGPDLGRC